MKNKTARIRELDFSKGDGLIPVIAQDFHTGKVLMLAYANEEALRSTMRTGYAHYWSRSRDRLWKKGETSGNIQRIRQIFVDCDSDTLLYEVEQKGNACHTGQATCFNRNLSIEKDPEREP